MLGWNLIISSLLYTLSFLYISSVPLRHVYTAQTFAFNIATCILSSLLWAPVTHNIYFLIITVNSQLYITYDISGVGICQAHLLGMIQVNYAFEPGL